MAIVLPFICANKQVTPPSRAHNDDAGIDLTCQYKIRIPVGATQKLETNCRMLIPKGHFGLVCGRSGLSTSGLLIHLGAVDSGYTGTIGVVATNLSNKPFEFEPGSRIGQLIIIAFADCILKEVFEFPTTERGDSGFGMSGIL